MLSSHRSWLPALLMICGLSAPAYAQHQPTDDAPTHIDAPSSQAQPMSFEQALHHLRGEDQNVRAAHAAVQRAEAERKVMFGKFFPEASVRARAIRMDAPIELTLDPVRDRLESLPIPLPPAFIPDFRYEIQRQGFFSVTLDAQMPLFTGGRLMAGLRAADLAIEASAFEAQEALDAGTTELVKRYFGARMADEAYNVRKQTADSLKLHAQNAQRLEEEGQISRAERLRAEVAYAEAQMELESAERQQRLTKEALRTLLSQDVEIEPTSNFFEVPYAPNLQELQQTALEHNPKFQAGSIGQRRAHEAVRAVRGEFSPTLGAFALVEIYRGDLTVLDPAWAIGLQLEWNIFQGAQRFHKLDAAKALEQEVALKVGRASQDIPLLVEQKHQAYTEALSQLRQFQRTQELAEESVYAQTRAFEAGMATSLDVVDAELTLSRVNLGILNALYKSNVAYAELMEAVGQSAHLLDMIQHPSSNVHPEVSP